MWNTKRTDYGCRKIATKYVEQTIHLMQEMYNTRGESILLHASMRNSEGTESEHFK